MSEMAYEFDEILEQIHHTLKTDDKQQFKEIFLENHTYDQAQIYLSLSEEQRQLVYQYLSPEDMAPVFEIIEEDVEDVEEYLVKDGSLCGYLFQCLHCGKYHLWVDAD